MKFPHICEDQWLQEHHEFLPYPFHDLYKCLQCGRVLMFKKVQSSASTVRDEDE